MKEAATNACCAPISVTNRISDLRRGQEHNARSPEEPQSCTTGEYCRDSEHYCMYHANIPLVAMRPSCVASFNDRLVGHRIAWVLSSHTSLQGDSSADSGGVAHKFRQNLSVLMLFAWLDWFDCRQVHQMNLPWVNGKQHQRFLKFWTEMSGCGCLFYLADLQTFHDAKVSLPRTCRRMRGQPLQSRWGLASSYMRYFCECLSTPASKRFTVYEIDLDRLSVRTCV